MTMDRSDPLWFKDAVIYQLHVKAFYDANDDGVGDFAGLMQKLDYVQSLGVTAIWLLPFYPSPLKDDGYDIADYRDVHPAYGQMADFRRLIRAAHERGLRVITELVINHTSDQHRWFQRARRARKGSPWRDYYVWSDSDQKYQETRIIFLDTEKSNWSWDPEAQAYFWHRFYSHQPDLNFDNPRVVREVMNLLHFWLGMGVDGLRLDAVPYLVEREGTNNENLPETHAILKRIRAEMDAHYPDRMLLAEANQWPEDVQEYFGDGDECDMAFHFPLMPRMYMAIAQEDRHPITDIMRQTPAIPDNCQWAIFLRNHDELTLEMVTDSERDYLWNTYAADRKARINLGIRRRLAPLMERDRRRIELMNALLLSMPGTPIIYYGDEIGMGDNIHLGDRDGVRTPMQWSPDRNGGFSRADPATLALPVIMDPLYGYEAVNVEAQQRDSHSLLNWTKRMLAVRGEHHAFGRGSQRFLRPANRKILAYLREHDGETILCVANLSRTAQAVELELGEFVGRTPVEMTGRAAFPPIGQLPYLLTLPPYGFYWFMLAEEAAPPDWSSTAPPSAVEQHTFVLRNGLAQVTDGADRDMLEREILPDYVAQRRWFAGKDSPVTSVRIISAIELPGAQDLVLAQLEIATGRDTGTYTLPLGIAWEGAASGPFAPNLALARVRRGRRVGLLTDGFAVPAFPAAVVEALRSGRALETPNGAIRFIPGEAIDLPEDAAPEWIAAEQSNSTVVLGQQAVMKLLRRIQPGVHPEAEMTRWLREHGFANVPPLFGEVVREGGEGEPCTLMIVQGFVYNQGDGWQWTLEALSRLADETEGASRDFENYRNFAESLGRRLAEMHAVLAGAQDDPAFVPEHVDEAGAETLAARVRAELEGLHEGAPLHAAIRELARHAIGQRRTRIHGDLHLGQVLVTAGDVMIIDFEGEPARPLADRRAKDLPQRDVAGVMRSFDYAAAAALRAMPEAADALHEDPKAIFTRFRDGAVEAFLRGYGEVAGDPSGPLLDLYLLEKAAYEVKYEAANRPDWIDIPRAGLERIIERMKGRSR